MSQEEEIKQLLDRIAELEKDKAILDWLDSQLVADGRYRCIAITRHSENQAEIELENERCGHPSIGDYASIKTHCEASLRKVVTAAMAQAKQ